MKCKLMHNAKNYIKVIFLIRIISGLMFYKDPDNLPSNLSPKKWPKLTASGASSH